MNLLQLHPKRCKQHKNTVMVVLETHLVIAKIKNLPQFLSSSSRVSIFCAARVVTDFSDRATWADNKIYGVSNFRCTGTLTRTCFWIKQYTVLKSKNLSFQWYQIELYGAFKLSWYKFKVKMNVFVLLNFCCSWKWRILMNFIIIIMDKSTGIPLSKSYNFLSVRFSYKSSQRFSEHNRFPTLLIWLSMPEPRSVSDCSVCSLKLLPNSQYIIHTQNNGINRS